MPNYDYRGLDRSGKLVTGQIAEDDERAATVRIRGLGVFPTEIKPAGNGQARAAKAPPRVRTASGRTGFGGRVGAGDLTIFSRQLANLVGSGISLMRAFTALTEHTENQRLKAALLGMRHEVEGGKALWEALAANRGIFPPLYINMVKAGEAGGQLATVLEWLADYLEKEQARRIQIRSALAYPTLLVTVGSLAVFLLVTLVVPRFVSIFQEFEQALPVPTVVLLGISGFMAHWWWAILCSVGAVAFGFREYSRNPAGRLRLDLLKLRLPLLGKLAMKSAVSRFARTTATLLKGGVTLMDSLAVVREVLGNEVLALAVDRVREGMREGESFAGRLRETGVFPPLLTHMVGVGEETGDLQNVLLTVANSYDIEVDAALKSIVSLIEPVIIVTVGGVIAFIILAMLLPVFQINLLGG